MTIVEAVQIIEDRLLDLALEDVTELEITQDEYDVLEYERRKDKTYLTKLILYGPHGVVELKVKV